MTIACSGVLAQLLFDIGRTDSATKRPLRAAEYHQMNPTPTNPSDGGKLESAIPCVPPQSSRDYRDDQLSASETQDPDRGNPINSDELLERCCGDIEFMGEVLEIFHDEASRLFEEIDAAARCGNLADLAELSHGLKGTAASAAAARLAAAASRVEQAARNDQPFGVRLRALKAELAASLTSAIQHRTWIGKQDKRRWVSK